MKKKLFDEDSVAHLSCAISSVIYDSELSYLTVDISQRHLRWLSSSKDKKASNLLEAEKRRSQRNQKIQIL